MTNRVIPMAFHPPIISGGRLNEGGKVDITKLEAFFGDTDAWEVIREWEMIVELPLSVVRDYKQYIPGWANTLRQLAIPFGIVSTPIHAGYGDGATRWAEDLKVIQHAEDAGLTVQEMVLDDPFAIALSIPGQSYTKTLDDLAVYIQGWQKFKSAAPLLVCGTYPGVKINADVDYNIGNMLSLSQHLRALGAQPFDGWRMDTGLNVNLDAKKQPHGGSFEQLYALENWCVANNCAFSLICDSTHNKQGLPSPATQADMDALYISDTSEYAEHYSSVGGDPTQKAFQEWGMDLSSFTVMVQGALNVLSIYEEAGN